MVAVLSVVLLIFAAFAVDLGMQRVARRDMQALADLVALDLARQLDGRRLSEINAQTPSLQALANRTLARNGDTVGSAPVVGDIKLGHLVDGQFVQQANPDSIPTAVEVSAATEVNFAFVSGSGGTSRSAVAESVAGACFSIGSYAARLKAGESPLLGPLLGSIATQLELDVLDYDKLADAHVTLAGLLSSTLGVGTFEELLEGDQAVQLGNFYLAVLNVLKKESPTSAAVGVLESLQAEVGALNLWVPVADLLRVGTGGAAGLDATLNVFDLLTAAAFAANGETALSLSELGIDLGPILDVDVSAHVTQRPLMGCGKKGATQAETSQVSLDLDASALDIDLGFLMSTELSLSGQVKLAIATGSLSDVRCDPKGITVDVEGGLLEVDLELEVVVRTAGIKVLAGPVRFTGTPPDLGEAVVEIVDDDYSRPAHVGAGSSGLPWLEPDTSALKLLYLPIGKGLSWVLDPLVEVVVNPLLQGLDAALLRPLSQSLGLSLSGADVYARPTPACGFPVLRG
ncbi:hypothetical protein H7344_17525 [Nocardioides deserti]|uniref:Putative Flp pilus-assembly TadG-like N-terminal domain-containing protein n=2 Tax=Nocardioides deserti TaxID=1588644 RepID=A0ABR6UE56_9ACTN|nr:hypothetical protein [Nocardioides deserti]